MSAWHILIAALGSLIHRPLRAVLTVLGMVFGVAAVVAMLAIAEGARREALTAIQELGIDNVVIDSVRPSAVAQSNSGSSGGEDIVVYGLVADDVLRLQRLVPGVAEAVVARDIRKPVFVNGRRVEVAIHATTPRWAKVARLAMQRGRFLTAIDEEDHAMVAVISSGLVRELAPLADPLGSTVRIGDQWFTIVGVLAPDQGSAGGNRQRDLFIPEKTARARFGIRQIIMESGSFQGTHCEFDRCVLRVGADSDAVAVGEAARLILNRPQPRLDISVSVPLELLRSRQRTQHVFTAVMASIASISLLVGGIGIMNIMLATVFERTREIGIRRAIGARRRDIHRQFLVEALLLSLCGGAIGLILGVVAAAAIAQIAGWPVQITWWSMLLASGICILVGVIFGWYPAARAARLTPVQALRGSD